MYGNALARLAEDYGINDSMAIIKIGYQHYAVPKSLAKSLISAAIDGTVYEVDSNYVNGAYQYTMKDEPIIVEFVLGTPMTKAQRADAEEKKAIAEFMENRRNGA